MSKEQIDFIDLSKKERNPRARVRLIALAHYYQRKKTREEIANILFYDRHTIGNWINSYEENGMEGLYDEQRSGRTPKLSKSLEQEFLEKLEDLQKDRKGGRVTTREIQVMLQKEFNVNYEESSIYDLLERLDVVWITARSKHPNSNPEMQENFKK